jgi:peptidoglycan hydrolase CwlO-like protein
MSPTFKRILAVTAIILSGLVILLCAAGVIGIWATSGKVIAAGTSLITAADKAVGAIQTGLESIDNGLNRLEEDTRTIEEATAQLSQNISDKGLVLVLLPPAKEEKLINTVAAIKDALSTVEQMLSSFIDTYAAIDSLPFVKLPKPDAEQLDSLGVKVGKLSTDIEVLQSNIQAARDNSAGAAQKISDAVGKINNGIEESRREIQVRNAQLVTTRITLATVKGSLPYWVYLSAGIITLLLLWIGYTQVLIIQFSLAKYKSA